MNKDTPKATYSENVEKLRESWGKLEKYSHRSHEDFQSRLKSMCDSEQAREQTLDLQTGRKKYTKKAFFLNGFGGDRPFGLNFRNTALVQYDGVVYKPTKAERYILDVLVYYDGSDEAHKKVQELDRLAKRNLSFPEWKRYSELRNVEFVCHFFCMNLNNDVYILYNLHNKFEQLRKAEQTDEVKTEVETLQQMIDCQRFRVEMKKEAADRFLKEHNVPPFLTFGVLQLVKEMFEEIFTAKLFDPLKTSQNAQELATMFDTYLRNRYNSLTK